MQLSHVFSLFLSAVAVSAAPASTVEERAPTPCLPVAIGPLRAAEVIAKFRASEIVPDLIPSIRPRIEVDVTYGKKEVDLGNTFSPDETVAKPDLEFSAEINKDPAKTKYMYFLIDPDVPSPNAEDRTTFLHWSVFDAQPSCIEKQNPKTSTVYQSLTPLSVAKHRYTFLVYRQPEGYAPSAADLAALQVRPGFDVNKYAKANGLELVGGNFLREGASS